MRLADAVRYHTRMQSSSRPNAKRPVFIWCVLASLSAIAIWVGESSRFRPLSAAEIPLPVTLAVPGLVNGTPSLAVSGRMVVAVWTAGKDGIVDVYAAASRDDGATFSDPRRVNDRPGDASANNEQPPRAVISGSGATRLVTIVWSKRNEDAQRARTDIMRMARSTDGGRTFTPASTTHDSAFSGARGWQSLAAGPDGSVHAVWLDGRDAARKMADTAARTEMAHNGQPPQDVYHGLIGPDGRTTEHLIASGVCFCCKTAVAVDARGAVYAAWRHIFPGSMRDIAFAKSTDGGTRFSPPVRVSDDKWELNGCPEDGPAIGVDASATIHIAWATLVTDGEPHKALFYATSRDGRTFSARAPVPTVGSTNPGHPQLALTPDGAAIVWDETVAGVRRVSMTRVARSGGFQPPQVVSGTESALGPVVARTSAGDLLVAWTSRPASSGPSAAQSSIKVRRMLLRRAAATGTGR